MSSRKHSLSTLDQIKFFLFSDLLAVIWYLVTITNLELFSKIDNLL